MRPKCGDIKYNMLIVENKEQGSPKYASIELHWKLQKHTQQWIVIPSEKNPAGSTKTAAIQVLFFFSAD